VHISRFVTALALPLALLLAGVASAQSGPPPAGAASAMSPAQMQAAVKSALDACHLSLRQKREIKPMVDNYKSAAASAPDDATKKAAAKTLLQNINGVLTPGQQATFKASLQNSMANATPSH